MSEYLAVAAIVKAEDPFLDEWIAYHRLMGVDYFILYDDDPRQNLSMLTARHRAYVTVFSKAEFDNNSDGRNRQTRAYEHSLKQTGCRWIAFIDVDEFIVMRKHSTIVEFLHEFEDAEAVALTWNMFGHNGYFENPPGLVTELHTRRQAQPGNMRKLIVKRESVVSVRGAHVCQMKCRHSILDENHKLSTREQYPGKTDIAHINHYFCRSFENWMARVQRGSVAYSPEFYPPSEAWKYDELQCLKKFVSYTKTSNELVDEFMLRYSDSIRSYLASL